MVGVGVGVGRRGMVLGVGPYDVRGEMRVGGLRSNDNACNELR